MNNSMNLPPELDKATDTLIQNLLASEPFLAYQKSQALVQIRLTCPCPDRATFRAAGGTAPQPDGGSVTEADIKELRAVQAEVQSNATLTAHSTAQQEAISFFARDQPGNQPVAGHGLRLPCQTEQMLLKRRTAMPYYDYRCKDCGKVFEVRISIKEKETDRVSLSKVWQSRSAPDFLQPR